MGASAPDDVDVRIRPHRRSRMPGRTRSVSMITDRIICSKLVRQVAASCPATVVGGGPPVLLTRMSTGPSVCSTSATTASSRSSSPRSHTSGNAFTPAAFTRAAVAANASADRPAAATFAPSAARRAAIALPSPPLAPSTRAVRPEMPRSIVALLQWVTVVEGGYRDQMLLQQRHQGGGQRSCGSPHPAGGDDAAPPKHLFANRQADPQLSLEVGQGKPRRPHIARGRKPAVAVRGQHGGQRCRMAEAGHRPGRTGGQFVEQTDAAEASENRNIEPGRQVRDRHRRRWRLGFHADHEGARTRRSSPPARRLTVTPETTG